MQKEIESKTIFLIVFIIIIIVMALLIFKNKKEKDKELDVQECVKAMQPGWNLGNTFDATGDETSWGNPLTTEKLIVAIADQGYKSIRIPITWAHRMGDAPDYTIDYNFLQRIQEVVDWSLDAGLYVIINMHHDSTWIMDMKSQHAQVLNKFNAAWKQIAEYFKDYPTKLMFESINEPRFSDDWNEDASEYFDMLNELNVSFHRIVRDSGGKNPIRPLVLPTLTCSASQERLEELSKTIEEIGDENIIATIHYYGYWPFSVNIAGKTIFDYEVREDIEHTIDRAYDIFVSKGIPVIIGEYGLLGFDKSLEIVQHGEMLKFFEYLTYYAGKKNMTLMWWDNGQHFDRQNFTWDDKRLFDVIMSSLVKGERSSYIERDFVFIEKGKPFKDAKLKIYFNGNSLVNIKNGNKELIRGVDYDIDKDILILKSDFLETIVTGEYGINTTLTCYFSKGADWDIDIICYEIPKLKSSRGLVREFLIPTEFNGDRLATMEAMYLDGRNAGPQNWTSFKEFGNAFMPLYDLNYIKVTENFFEEVQDGEILFKMHFWSGNIVEYNINKDGMLIEGKVYNK